MKKIVTIFLAFMFAVTIAAAQNGLVKVVNDFRNSGSFSMNFSARGENGENISGILSVQKNRYNIKSTEQELINDGKLQYTITPKNKEVIIEPTPNETSLLSSPQKLFAIDVNEYNIVPFAGETYQVTPKKANSDIRKAVITLSGGAPSKLVVTTSDGGSFSMNISSVKLNTPLSEGLFTFNSNQYKDYEIIDFR